MSESGLDSVTVLDLCGFCPRLVATRGLRLVVSSDQIGAVSSAGVENFARPDAATTSLAQAFGRRIAPFRAASQNAVDAADDDRSLRTWSQMLGIGNVARFNPEHGWLPRQGRDRLRVPIGVGQDGNPVELDLKESAENGMGPHGLCIGATGSGKSEFLRTLVLGLIATHSPDALNLVLIDFKGGATFLGLEEAPHVAAIITNLAEELAMVDRMKDALAGEMNRRQNCCVRQETSQTCPITRGRGWPALHSIRYRHSSWSSTSFPNCSVNSRNLPNCSWPSGDWAGHFTFTCCWPVSDSTKESFGVSTAIFRIASG